jgi:diguanylate cyclase (GGDEF)-like protein
MDSPSFPNRALYNDRLDEALAAAAARSTPVAVLLMDLDHFKDVNDSLGHPIGDLILCAVSSRLELVLKRPTDTVARLGGDEFAILLPGDDAAKAERVAKALLHALDMPMTPEGHVVDVRASIGIAVYPEHGSERSTLLRHADAAMYAAKRRNLGIALWDERYDLHSKERLSLMSGLRKAVDEDELVLSTNPRSRCAARRPAAARRWCAGGIRRVGWSRRSSSSPSPEQTGPYARSRIG